MDMDYLGYEVPWDTLGCSVYFDWMTPWTVVWSRIFFPFIFLWGDPVRSCDSRAKKLGKGWD